MSLLLCHNSWWGDQTYNIYKHYISLSLFLVWITSTICINGYLCISRWNFKILTLMCVVFIRIIGNVRLSQLMILYFLTFWDTHFTLQSAANPKWWQIKLRWPLIFFSLSDENSVIHLNEWLIFSHFLSAWSFILFFSRSLEVCIRIWLLIDRILSPYERVWFYRWIEPCNTMRCCLIVQQK